MKLTPPPNETRRDAGAALRTDRPVDRAEAPDVDLAPIAALAHDLRSPISAVLGFARLAREDLRAGDLARASALLDRLERSATTLDAMLRSALGEPVGPSAASLAGVLEQLGAERKRELELRGIRLVAPADAPVFSVHQADLYRLLGNLVGNAIDHMGDVREASITVSVTCQGERATLRVSDNGAGIAPEQRERVFELAHSRCRADAAQRHRGLGLTIVRELAASWGGHAWVEETREPGATVCVTIPVAR